MLEVAPDLVGKYLVRKFPDGTIQKFRITEVEAYDGEADLACHACRGKTERTKVLYGEAGVWYVYLIYGMYYMLNIVTGPKNYPAAVLIRGIESISGPGKITREFKITKSLNNKKSGKGSGLWFEDSDKKISKNQIRRTPRIGVDYAGPIWSKKEYRFVLKK